jgi:hypothetical protein
VSQYVEDVMASHLVPDSDEVTPLAKILATSLASIGRRSNRNDEELTEDFGIEPPPFPEDRDREGRYAHISDAVMRRVTQE